MLTNQGRNMHMSRHDGEYQQGSKVKKWIAGGLAATFVAAAALYTVSSIYSHNGSEFKIVMNKGEPKSVTDTGLGFAFGWYDKIFSLPMTRQITSVADNEVNLRSKDGEEFIGGLRIEYQFRFESDEEKNKRLIKTLFRDFNITDTKAFWDTDAVDPVEKTIKARATTAAVAEFGLLVTDQYQAKMESISSQIQTRLQGIMDKEGLPVNILIVDTTGVTPSKEVQDRINRIAMERRESDRANVIVENEKQVTAAAKTEAAVTLAFTEELRTKGYSENAIIALNCQRLADRADRFGIPFGAACNGTGSGISVTVDPQALNGTAARPAPVAIPKP